MGKPGFPTPLPVGGPGPQAGVWGNPVSPYLCPREGLGGRSPPKKNLCSFPFVCGGAAWTAEVNIGYESQYLPPQRMRRPGPPPNLPPLGGSAGLPPPSGGRAGEGGSHLRCNGLPLKQGDGKPGFPTPRSKGPCVADSFLKDHKPSAMECEARLHGLERSNFSKTMCEQLPRAHPCNPGRNTVGLGTSNGLWLLKASA